MKMHLRALMTLAFLAACAAPTFAAPPTIEMTWMSIANWYFKIGDKRILMDGYITRVPESLFDPPPVFPNDLYAYTKGPYGVDMPAITKVRDAGARHRQARPAARRPQPLGPQLGHAGVVADDRRADDRRPLGLPAGDAQGVPAMLPHRQRRREDRARQRHHDARRALEPQRRRHQSDPAFRARAVSPARADPATGGLRAGVGEDYPNGGGNRAFLFTVDCPRASSRSSSTTRPARSTSTRTSSSTASTTARRSATWRPR